jgi:hypothetical protein
MVVVETIETLEPDGVTAGSLDVAIYIGLVTGHCTADDSHGDA